MVVLSWLFDSLCYAVFTQQFAMPDLYAALCHARSLRSNVQGSGVGSSM
jgi:hypothetical protein